MTDDSPLIRNECRNRILRVSEAGISNLVHDLFFRAGIIEKGKAERYPIRPHSLRKYFETQLVRLGIPKDYVEYMMGHTISTYNSVDVEYLRNLYSKIFGQIDLTLLTSSYSYSRGIPP